MSRALKKPSFSFNENAQSRLVSPEQGLTFVIRTDADFTTSALRDTIKKQIESDPSHPLNNVTDLDNHIRKITHNAYERWGHKVLAAKASCIDYSRYNVKKEDEELHIHFYNTQALTDQIINLALERQKETPDYDPNIPVMFISLDDMITKQCEPWADIGFSRLFDHEGKDNFGFTARPGMNRLHKQIENAKEQLKELSQEHGQKIPVVLLEDNVRHAEMLNWIIGLMEDQDLFDHAELLTISTCFCCADDTERAAIKQGDKTVPLTIAIDYKDSLMDVHTPRDLLLDGFVIEINGKKTRLPGIFMDAVERFKIAPSKENKFKKEVIKANIKFCETLEKAFSFKLPLSWFKGADAISHLYNYSENTPMLTIMNNLYTQTQNNNHAPTTIKRHP